MQASTVVVAMAFFMASMLTHPCEQARSGPRRFSRAETLLAVVGTLGVVEEVVDEVSIHLHDKGKEQAQHSRRPVEWNVVISL